MKRKFIVIVFLLLLFETLATAQIYQKGFSFQGYARDFDGNAIGGRSLFVRFSIYKEGNSGNPSFTELHSTVKTDAFGVFTLIVGSVNEVAFQNLNWSKENYYLSTEVSVNNSDFISVSNNQLLSVPYAQAASNGVPSGSILPYAGEVSTGVPFGYLVCDGALKNISDYPNLFAAIGTAWGGDGVANFRVPDLRGYFLRGVSNETNTDPDAVGRFALNGGNDGDQVGSYQGDITASHNHTGTTTTNGQHTHVWGKGLEGDDSGSGGSHAEFTNIGGSNSSVIQPAGDHNHTFQSDNTGGAETRPKNANVWYIIKF